MALPLSGCTSLSDYVHNGFKVGPNYCPPPAPVEKQWIDAADKRVVRADEPCFWWEVFNDPKLSQLVVCAYRQNLTLREAGFRVLQARARLNVVRGEFFPQLQTANGSFQRIAVSENTANGGPPIRFFNQWDFGFNLAWELDFWGRFRRAIAASEAQLQASAADYDQVLVTLVGDVASNYVQARTLQERIRAARETAREQEWARDRIDQLFRGGQGQNMRVNLGQATSNYEQTLAAIHELEIALRQTTNRLCILLGIPPVDLERIPHMLGQGPIPAAPPEVAAGIPADLLRRRPDVRRAERLAAAQAEFIGIAEAQLYPAFAINGTLGWQAENLSDLFTSRSLAANVGPSFQWNILNYGRLINNVRLQDARFRELVVAYQETVLQALREVEDGLVVFVQAHGRERHLTESVKAATDAVVANKELLNASKRVDFNQYAVIAQNWGNQKDQLAQSHGEIAQGLIQVYRAMGGGWEVRCERGANRNAPPPLPAEPPNPMHLEGIPAPEGRPNAEQLPSPPAELGVAPLPPVPENTPPEKPRPGP
jgi:NodT family efflux transporter outer membrane factor (OMF) lipoprotein